MGDLGKFDIEISKKEKPEIVIEYIKNCKFY